MTNVFEQPWLFLIAALVVFLAVGTWRALIPDKNRWWQWCFPLAVALVGLGLDFFVATDHEQVVAITRALLRVVAAEEDTKLAPMIASNYRDKLHLSRERFLSHTRSGLSQSPINKLTKISREVESLTSSEATIRLFVGIVFEKESVVASVYKQQVLALLRIHLAKQSDGTWQIYRIDLLEVDKQPMNWDRIPSQVW